MKIDRFRRVDKGAILANFNVIIPEYHDLTIYGMTLFQKDGRSWVALPARQYESEGKKKYAPHVCWSNPQVTKKFCASVVEAALKEYAAAQAPVQQPQAYAEAPSDSDEGLPF